MCAGGSRGFLHPQERKPALLIPFCPFCPSTFLHVRGTGAAPAADAIPTQLQWCRMNRGFSLAKHWEMCPALDLLKEQPAHHHSKQEAQIVIER